MRSYARSIALYEEARRHLAGGVSSNVRYASAPVPLFFERGEGARLFDVDGNAHIDYVLGNGPAILGHAPGPVIDAVADSLRLGQVYAAQHAQEVALARRLGALLPSAELVRFASSGTEAVQLALRIARAFTGRRRIVKFEGHYHGWMDSVYVSVRPAAKVAGPADAPTPVLESEGQADSVLGDLVVLGWNDASFLADAFERHRGEIAGVLMEPVMVNGGVAEPRPGYLEAARRLCDAHGALLIFDEVITGFRVGLRGAQGRYGVRPDLTILAKAVAAGFPLSAVAGRRDAMNQVFDGGAMHGGTYNGNVQSVAAGLAALDVLAAGDGAVYRDMERRGTRLMQGLRAAAGRAGARLLVQGLPAIFQTTFTDKPALHDYRDVTETNSERGLRFWQALQDEGVRVTQRGVWFLSAAHGDAEIDETLAAAARALSRVG
jgi:glutamate-1-semialdehyde 2,1-aminomutase